MHPLTRPALLGIIALALTAMTPAATAQEITIYRCTDGQGQLTLRDTPCADDQQQQRIEMMRPKDPPPTTAADTTATPAPTTASPPAATPPPRVIVLRPAQPVYRCVTPDGDHYTSDDPAGNPRWVPLWTLGYPVYPRPGRVGRPGHRLVVPQRPVSNEREVDRFKFDNVGRPTPEPSRDRPDLPLGPPVVGVGLAPGAWVSDQCHQLPQEEVCDYLRDQRWELGRRYNSALQSERRQIDAEQRLIDARLANDCRAG